MSALVLLFTTLLEDTAMRQVQEIKGVKIGKEEIKLFLFQNGKFVFVEDYKECTTNQ